MGRNSVFVAIAFLAGIAVGFGVRSVRVLAMPQSDTRAANLAAIEKLHQEDIQVTLSQNEKGLTDIWTDDAVRFNPPNPPAVGKQAIRVENEKFHAQYPGFKVLSYTPKFSDIQIKDGLACEGVESEANFKMSADSPPTIWHAQGFRVLKRQSDGSWKFAVLIMNQ
jgi:ketosteroid isomerase-like protein